MAFGQLIVFWFIVTVIQGCVLPEGKPSWSIVQRSSRTRRAAESLDPRMNCGPVDTAPPTRVDTSPLLEALLEVMAQQNLDALLVPTADAHQSEDPAPSDERRKRISGFSGTAGTAVVLANGSRALWTDGRYFLQAEDELDCHWMLMKEDVEKYPTILEWLKDNLPIGAKVGADPLLTSAPEWMEYDKDLRGAGMSMVATQNNLVDQVAPPTDEELNYNERPIQVLELQFAGKPWEEKVEAVRAEMKKVDVEMMVVTSLDEVAWLLNLRGGDVKNTPVFKSYAVIDDENVKLFIKEKINPRIDLHLHVNSCDNRECVEIHDYDTIKETIAGLSNRRNIRKVMLPSKLAYSGGVNYAIYSAVPEEKRVLTVSPILPMKATKNDVEIEGMHNAHKKDAVALIDFLSFLEEEMAQKNYWTELSAAKRLMEFRAQQKHFEGLSFDSISAMGSNGAIIHYRPQNSTDTQLTDQSLYLLDSGAQYRDGTTDVTRTMHYGTPTAFQIEAYTRVLIGAIDLARVVFPEGTKDTRVDILARGSLYSAGLDYQHGTGHGIGMFMYVHESPTQIRIYAQEEHVLKEGFFFSDEPGYYKAGEFGIRLETILSVVSKKTKYESFVPMLGFEPVTLVPFETNLIDVSLLTKPQCEFLNKYHMNVKNTIGPLLKEQGRTRGFNWLVKKTEHIECSPMPIEVEIVSQQKSEPLEATPATMSSAMHSVSEPILILLFALQVLIYR